MVEIDDTSSTTVELGSESSTVASETVERSTDEASKDINLPKEEEVEKKPGGISLRIWPPTQKTRDAVLSRLIETLTTESILSKRYGTLNSEEATAVAKSIEEEAYEVASGAVSADDDGIEILQVYSKEISKRMLDSVKARSATTADNGTGSTVELGEDSKADSSEDAASLPEKAEA